jgi:two-component system response regulator HydG
MPHALIIEVDLDSLRGLSRIAQADGFTVDTAHDLASARGVLARCVPDIVLVDVNLPDGIGLDLLPELPQLVPGKMVPTVVMTGNATVEGAVASLRLGVWDYLAKPVDIGRLRNLLGRVPRPADLSAEVESLRTTLREMGRFGDMIGRSPVMQRLYDTIAKIAPIEADIMIFGESGTGKELAARTLHQLSGRRKGPFVGLNCRAISPSLIESTLFGHERDAFTGATVTHVGVFEQARGGTLFLDEITEMPLEQQAQLLHILETRRFARLGSKISIDADFRLISATDHDPQQAVSANTVYPDLFHRFNAFPLTLPPLRERGDDVILLATYFIDQLNQTGHQNKYLSPSCYPALLEHTWPGNVRELRSQLERSFIVADSIIENFEFDVNGAARESASVASANGTAVVVKVGTQLADAERQLIEAAMKSTSGVRSKAAQMLGISPKTLYNKLKQFEANV